MICTYCGRDLYDAGIVEVEEVYSYIERAYSEATRKWEQNVKRHYADSGEFVVYRCNACFSDLTHDQMVAVAQAQEA